MIVDSYRLDFRNSQVRPSVADFKKAVKIFEPREAFIDHSFNSQRLKRSDLVDVGANDPCPDIINWLHYCNGKLVRLMGGIEHCLKTPAFKTEKFLDGVLIQLTKDWFDPDNREHLDVQLRAMRHLKLIP